MLAASRSSTGRARAVRVGQQAAQERLAAAADQQRKAQRGDLGEPVDQRPVVVGGLGEPQPGVEHQPVVADARRAGGRHPLGQLAASPRRPHHRPRRTTRATASGRRGRASAWRRRSRPEPATTSRIAGSASPPETSLTIRAPAASAARATSARMVSTETTASRASASITGTTRASSSVTSGRVAPGRVDSPPTSRMSAPSASSRRPWAIADVGVGVETAVGEGVGRDVDDPHQLRRHGRSGPPVDQRHRLGPGRGVAHADPRIAEVMVRAPALLDPAHRHAEVLGLDHHDDAAGLEDPPSARRRPGWSAAPGPAAAWRRRRPAAPAWRGR